MPYTINDLISSRHLSEVDVRATLAACGLSPNQSEYSDEDITSKFDVVRGLFADGRVKAGDYKTAKEIFTAIEQAKSAKNLPPKAIETTNVNRKNQKGSPSSKTPLPFPTPAVNQQNQQPNESHTTADSSTETLTISDLIALAKKYLDLDLTLKQVVSILELSGLPDKKYYDQQEANRFITFCGLTTQGNSTDVNSLIGDTTVAFENGLISLLNEITKARAKEIPQTLKQLFLQNVVLSLAESQEDIESFFLQIKDSIIQGVEGKSLMRSILATQWITIPSPDLTSSLNQLPSVSESGTSAELDKESKRNGKP
jgi:hypothetical protein